MVERKVTSTKRDRSGNIISVCNNGEWWSPRNTLDIINDLQLRLYDYYVIVDGKQVFIKVINGSSGKYLRTDPDKTTKNNLDDLPDC